MEKFDLCIIGAGPSGYAAAMRALDFKKRVLLIEKGKVGGTGVSNGALSSKTWWEISREHLQLRKQLENLKRPAAEVRFSEIKQEVNSATTERISLLENHMYRLRNITGSDLFHYVIGEAKLLNPPSSPFWRLAAAVDYMLERYLPSS